MKIVEAQGKRFAIGKLDAFQQLHVGRRIAPIMTRIGMSITALQALTNQISGEQVGETIMSAAMEVVAGMSNEDVDFVTKTCLSVVSVVQGEGQRPAPLMSGGALMFSDLTLRTMVQLSTEVVRENLADFFPMLGGEPDLPRS